jgi:hypothetical protein
MKFSQAFPSKYLKATDLNGDEFVVTIANVKMEQVGDDNRPVLYFNEVINGSDEKGLVLNKTNGNKILNATGIDDMRKWIGLTLKLYEDEVTVDGKTMATIRVKLPKAQPARDQSPGGPAKPTNKYADKDLDDDVPFSAEYR